MSKANLENLHSKNTLHTRFSNQEILSMTGKTFKVFRALRNTSIFFSSLKCPLSRENLNSTFSASYIKMTITFDVLDRFQENSLFVLYISTAKPFSLVRGYIEVKINKH